MDSYLLFFLVCRKYRISFLASLYLIVMELGYDLSGKWLVVLVCRYLLLFIFTFEFDALTILNRIADKRKEI